MTIVTLSTEIELGWGVHDVGQYYKLSDRREAETRCLDELLDACDEAGLPFSFDVVGHLFLDACEGFHESPHDEDWWDADPGTGRDADPWFYAPDMLDSIDASDVDHEVCTHSFSHVDCDHVDDEVVTWDLLEAQRQHERRYGEWTRAFVPPKHRVPPVSALHEADIEITRQHIEEPLSKAEKLKQFLFGPLPNRPPRLSDGVVTTYCATYPSLTSPVLAQGSQERAAVFRYLPFTTEQIKLLHRRKLVNAVERAKETDTPLHLWTHLYNMSNEDQLDVVRDFLAYLRVQEANSEIEVLTMDELNTRVRSRR